jgi:hypothetical protein
MKSHRYLLPVVLLSLSTLTFAQTDAHGDAHKSDASKAEAQKPAAPKTETQLSFEKLKALEGTWEGKMNVIPAMPSVDGMPTKVQFRVFSRGHTLMHDLKPSGLPDEPVTMFVVDNDRLLLTHFCDGDNRPRMVGKTSADGKTIEFDFLDITGKLNVGHMHHAVFTFIDENHHTEEWTYMMPGDKPARMRVDFQRTKDANLAAVR